MAYVYKSVHNNIELTTSCKGSAKLVIGDASSSKYLLHFNVL